MKTYGTLYLVPSLLSPGDPAKSLPAATIEKALELRHYIVEELRTARRFLKILNKSVDIDAISFTVYNEHTRNERLDAFLEPLLQGHDTGLLSEAGVPCVGDPGHALVLAAHEIGIRVKALSGPSSILLALTASGLDGNRFQFHGYLPVDKAKRVHALRTIEKDARKTSSTQVFIETPYRNRALLNDILAHLDPSTLLCVAADLTGDQETIITRRVAAWKTKPPELPDKPAVFLVASAHAGEALFL